MGGEQSGRQLFSGFFRRLIPRMGIKKAIWAAAHRLLRVMWKVLHAGVHYIERGPLEHSIRQLGSAGSNNWFGSSGDLATQSRSLPFRRLPRPSRVQSDFRWCQSATREKWLAAQSRDLLPVPYCHLVFTLPKELSGLALQNPQTIYCMLFRAVSETLLTIAADPRRLGARIGLLAVLHTWNQKLLQNHHS
jgi:transposase-like zinc-binding protein